MIFPPNFIPIEYTGISIITALVFFFASIGMAAIFTWNKQEHQRIRACVDDQVSAINIKMHETNNRIELLFIKLDNLTSKLNENNMYMAKTVEAIEWLKKDRR